MSVAIEKVLTNVVTCESWYLGRTFKLIIKGVRCVVLYKVDHSSMTDPSIFGAIFNYDLYIDLDYRFPNLTL